jgi:hydroxymethylglutaryl-CoA reductase (NADPH)
MDLSALRVRPETLGAAEERNCEQMFGQLPLPVGLAGPLAVTFSCGETLDIDLPLATTEGALVASVNRGCKAVTASGGATVRSLYRGVTRSMAFRMGHGTWDMGKLTDEIQKKYSQWKDAGEATSGHLKMLSYDIDVSEPYIFLTIACDTDEAMGMNMTTIAADAIALWIEKNIPGLRSVCTAANVDSDKKPSRRTHDKGRGYEVTAEVLLTPTIVKEVLRTTPERILEVADAKLTHGSNIAGAIGANLHAANIIAALYLATGQDAAHVVEGSLADTCVEERELGLGTGLGTGLGVESGIFIQTKLPAILVGVCGGGTTLPAQMQCRNILLKTGTALKPVQQLAESIGAAVLAGEISLLAALATHDLGKAHRKLGRK